MTKFFLRKFVISSMIADSFLVEKWGTLEVARGKTAKTYEIYVIQIVFVLAVFAIIENKWNINYIQTLPAQIQQKLLRKLLEKVFITNISTQCKHHTP